MISDFDEYRFFNWTLVRAYEEINLENSIFYYERTLQLVRKAKMNGYNEAALLHILTQLDYKLGKYDRAFTRLNEIERVNLSAYAKKRLEVGFKIIEKLKNQLKTLKN